MIARFTKRVRENKGNPRGIEHTTLFADLSLYEVSFPNVQTEDLTGNVIDKNMLYQVHSEGHHYQILKDISDLYADGITLKRINEFIRSRGGNLHAKNTNRSWKLYVEWKYETFIQIPLKGI